MTETDLKKILEEHAKWLETEGKEGERADLSEADLSEANLSGAILPEPPATDNNVGTKKEETK